MSPEAKIRYLPDGSYVSTSTGYHHTKEAIRRIVQALSGRPKPQEQVRAESIIWEIVKLLAVRLEALSGEIAEVTGFTNKQVRNALYRKRPDWNAIPSFTPEQVRERKRRGAAPGQPKRLADRQVSDDQKKSILLAKALYETGLITEDTSYWDRLHGFYSQYQRSLPEDFYQKLALEVFLSARIKLQEGNPDLFTTYRDISKDLLPTSLIPELKFISSLTNNTNAVEESGDYPSTIDFDSARFLRAIEFFRDNGVSWPES